MVIVDGGYDNADDGGSDGGGSNDGASYNIVMMVVLYEGW